MFNTKATCSLENLSGQPCLRLTLPSHDSVLVSMLGAQVLSWVVQGRERLYLSPESKLDGHSAIRGGIPICCPQFNQRGTLPKHGFFRNQIWRPDELVELGNQSAQVTFRLAHDPASLLIWPHEFAATVQILLQPGRLQVNLGITNRGKQPLQMTGALHTYLSVDEIEAVWVEGLQRQTEWDALTDQRRESPNAPIQISGEFDRVYTAPDGKISLVDGIYRVSIEQSLSFFDTVVWNPGESGCANLNDMPNDGHRKMICIEAANVWHAVELMPGQFWHGWQRLTVA